MPYEVVKRFEQRIADYAGAKYGIAVESCCAALFLSCKYMKVDKVSIPKRTYPGVACSIINSGGKVQFGIVKWSGVYPLIPYDIIDGALRFKRGMYNGGLHCLSFHAKKHLPIGRGGMILTDSYMAYEWLKKARFDGRSECPMSEDEIDMVGWNAYMTPDQAARGLMLFDAIKDRDLPDLPVEKQGYPDLSKIKAYR